MRKAFFQISIILLTFFSCKVRSRLENKINTKQHEINAEIGDITIKSDPFEMINYHLNEDTLYLKISFRGKYKNHTFRFIGSPAISKSLPPIRQVKLIHHANGDLSGDLITSTIKINLKPIAYKTNFSSEIILQSDDWNEKIRYKSSKK